MAEFSERFRDTNYNEVINLREVINTLWKQRWIIIVVTVTTGLIAFLVSSFLIPEKYQATAIITVVEYKIKTDLESSIQTLTVELNIASLPQLAESDAIINLTYNELGITDWVQRDSLVFSSVTHGDDQLILQVKAEDPILTAKAANTWAKIVTERINTLYGEGDEALIILQNEVTNEKANWSAAQLDLENYLPEGNINSVRVRLSVAQAILSDYLQEIGSNGLLISDIQALQKQIEENNPEEFLNMGLALSLITLQQRAANAQDFPGLGIEVDSTIGEGIQTNEAVEILRQLKYVLEDQNKQLASEIPALEKEISELVLILEKEKFQVDQLTQERDLARQAYIAISSQLEETRISQTQDVYLAKIGAEAIIPRDSSEPNILLATLLTGFISLLAITSLIFFIDWWKFGDQSTGDDE